MAVGMLIGEGRLRLQDKVIDLFGGKKNLLNIFRLKDITVEHLLTMTSCVSFNETGIVSGNDWVRGYLESGLIGVPGKKFEYNSMNSYMLSAIITEVTGESLMEYLRPRLWEPWESKGFLGNLSEGDYKGRLGIILMSRGCGKARYSLSAAWQLERTAAGSGGLGGNVP